MKAKTFSEGDAVMVTDDDGTVWLGVIELPSMLWDNWYIVRRVTKQRRTGKCANYHVHINEMVKR